MCDSSARISAGETRSKHDRINYGHSNSKLGGLNGGLGIYTSRITLISNDKKRCNGAPTRTRTADLLITNQLLYQLSYRGNR
jgi:hypothetical protein